MVYDGGEKMAITSSNQWPQQQQQQQQQNMEERKAAMEKPSDLALKCPRCDSSNTKFCYYNNYSLSQPRHFCKACKRYWTRGGTLRNVPVGGGCRKNKRIKRPAAADPPSLPPPPPSRQHIDVSTPPSDVNRLIYGLPTTPSDVNLPFPHLGSAPPMLEGKVPYDLHQHQNQHQHQPHHLNSSSMWLSFPPAAAGDPLEEEYRTTGFKYNNNPSQISDAAGAVSSPSLLSPDYCSAFGFSSLEKQKLFANLKASRPAGNNDYHLYFPFHDLQMASRAGENSANQREMKMEQQEKGIMFNNSFETDGANNSSLYWSADSTLFGSSSIAPLI